MNYGPHRLLLLRFVLPIVMSLALLLNSSCSSFEEKAPPAAGTISSQDPEAGALFAKAKATEDAGKTKKAISLYQKTFKEHPYSDSAPSAKFREAQLLDRSGELLDAFEAYDTFIQRFPGSSLYAKAIERQSVVAHAAAQGHITNNFLGIKSRIDRGKTTEMLAKVRDNAPRSSEAPKAQFAIAQVWEGGKRPARAITAYEELLDNYPNSSLASRAQYQIGIILLDQSSDGNQNPANLDKADDAFRDLLQRYPNSKYAPEARKRLGEIAGLDLQRSYNIAEFYFKKKQYASASFYFKEVIKKAPNGDLKNRANQRLAELNSLTS